MIHDKPTVFISFNSGSKDFVDCLEKRLSKEAVILRYEDRVPAWGSFTAFMDTVKEQDFAVLVISDAYLKSYACMYEVMQAMRNTNWKDRVIVALMPDTKPYKDAERIEYIRYWSEQYEETCQRIKGLPSKAVESITDKCNRLKSILDSIDGFLAFVADSNCPPIYSVIEEICERVKISKKAVFTYTAENGETMNMRLLCVLDYIRENPLASIANIAVSTGISVASAKHSIKRLIELGMITVEAHGRVKVYSVA